jgi:hypothetical protein
MVMDDFSLSKNFSPNRTACGQPDKMRCSIIDPATIWDAFIFDVLDSSLNPLTALGWRLPHKMVALSFQFIGKQSGFRCVCQSARGCFLKTGMHHHTD